ncbi:MAG: DUF2752 domain-containing protein [Saprospiraceae bacterium]|nr:DUF2752 domain-containing protein [Saprospiraceae bacterium]
MWQKFIEWLESNMQSCFYRRYFGIECPGCGMQRAFVELLKGNLLQSLKIYPALLPTIFLFFYLILHLVYKYKNGAFVLKISFIFTVSLMVINYILKVIFVLSNQ